MSNGYSCFHIDRPDFILFHSPTVYLWSSTNKRVLGITIAVRGAYPGMASASAVLPLHLDLESMNETI
jgi:hypothetical protein